MLLNNSKIVISKHKIRFGKKIKTELIVRPIKEAK